MQKTAASKKLPPLSEEAAKRWATFTKRSNAAFAKMSKAEKRVAIAKDVLAQMKTGAIQARTGLYVLATRTSGKADLDLTAHDLSEVLPYFDVCQVCAVGSVMVCTVMRDDNVEHNGQHVVAKSMLETYEVAQRFFTQTQLETMELFFESYRSIVDADLQEVAWERLRLSVHRLELIMEHIVETKGSFVKNRFRVWLRKRLGAPSRKKSHVADPVAAG